MSSKNTIHPWFRSREDYEAIRLLVTDEPKLGDTYEQWLEMENKLVEELRTHGIIVKQVFIDPDEFTTYCRTTGIDHNGATLLVFTVYAAAKQRDN